jgi:hypothetical protein
MPASATLMQVASRAQVLARLRIEKEELAKMKKGPEQINPDEASRQRLADLRKRVRTDDDADAEGVDGGASGPAAQDLDAVRTRL